MDIRKMTGVAMLVASGIAGSAGAQAVNFQGAVNGCFYTGSTPSAFASCAAGSNSVGFLTYTGSTFNATTNAADGVLTLGRAPATPNFNNLGSLSLGSGAFNYTGQKFALFMSFTNPSAATGNGTYTATLTGNLTGTTTGNVFVDFDNTAHTFTFTNGTTLTFAVNDVSINNETTSPATVSITGQGVATLATTTPEPSTLALLGTGIIGLVPMFRRKK